MKRLRIVFLTSAFEMRASYWRAFFLSKYLIQRGHEVFLIATSRKATFRVVKKMIDGVQVLLLPSLVNLNSNLFLYWLSIGSTVLMQTPLNCILETVADADVLHAFDVIVPQNATPTLFSRLCSSLRIRNSKIFVDWDDWYGRGGILSHVGGLYSAMEPIITFLEEKVPLYADGVTVLNEPLRQRALWAGVKPSNLFVLPNGADVDVIKPLNIEECREKLNLPKEKIIFTNLGMVEEETLKLILTTFNNIARRFPATVLLLIGLTEYQISLVESSNQNRNVICVERVPRSEVPLYLGASDVLLMLLLDTVHHRAASPMRLGEFLAAGRPIVATALPEIAKIVGKSGLLFKPNDPKEFASKISDLIRNADLREEMGKHARELAEKKYSWRIISKHLEEVYGHYL